MDLDLFHIHFFNVFEEIYRRRVRRLRYRRLRDVSNPFAMPEENFIKMYRLPIQVVQDILIPQIENHIQVGVRASYVPIHLRVLATLHLLAQGNYQASIGSDNLIALSQSTVSKIVTEVIEIIAIQIFNQYIKFPTLGNEVNIVMQGFFQKFNFPNVIGAIDCTHIAIQSPPVNNPLEPALAYFNRKGYYSLNVQTICDADLRILAINARFPGATHDAAIWATSSINRYLQRQFEQGENQKWLLGDSGYPLSPYLMTPILGINPNDGSPEARYNRCHARARNTIERCFGVFKQRFRCLSKHRVLHYNHRKAGLIVYACAVLHNILIERHIDINVEVDDDSDSDVENDPDINLNADILAAGRNVRNALVRNF